MLFSFDPNNHNKAVLNYCMDIARSKKEWAEKKNKELNGQPWNASHVSVEMLNEYTSKTIEELAISQYKYLKLRSHSFSKFGTPIDPTANRKWIELAGSLEVN